MSKAVVITSGSVEHTMEIGRAIALAAEPGDVIAVDGELGAGKTQLVRGMAMGLGIGPERVSSPTFVISHEYEPEDAALPVLVHVDAYRLAGPGDLDSIGWGEGGQELRDGAIVAIEWAQRVMPALGDDLLHVQIVHAPGGRRLTITPYGNWKTRALTLTQTPHNPKVAKPHPKCPICSTPITDAGALPFCSERCKQVDLNRWFDGRYLVSRPIQHTDLEEEV